MNKKYIFAVLLLLIGGIVGGLKYTNFALGVAFEFPPSAKTATATTSPTYMSEGTATTTITYDAFDLIQGTSGFNPTGASNLYAFTHVVATTGVPTLNIACESSQDGVDWFKRDCYNTSTTTNIANISGEMSTYTWIFASSTCAVGGTAPLSNQSVCTRGFNVDSPTRFTRLVASLASTTAVSQAEGVGNADIWFELVPQKERNGR